MHRSAHRLTDQAPGLSAARANAPSRPRSSKNPGQYSRGGSSYHWGSAEPLASKPRAACLTPVTPSGPPALRMRKATELPHPEKAILKAR